MLFTRSRLPNEALAICWQLSDRDNDGKLSFPEFLVGSFGGRGRWISVFWFFLIVSARSGPHFSEDLPGGDASHHALQEGRFHS